jgi:hypothetical protein
MDTSIILVTAVPSNIINGTGVLTALISPQLVVDSDIDVLSNWTTLVIQGNVLFNLQLDGIDLHPDTLSLDKSRLDPDLWPIIFAGAALKKKSPSTITTKDDRGNTTRGPKLPISNQKVNLKVTRDIAIALHRGFTMRRAGRTNIDELDKLWKLHYGHKLTNPDGIAPTLNDDLANLLLLHHGAALNHSLYDPDGTVPTLDQPIDPAVIARITGNIPSPGQAFPQPSPNISYNQKALNAMAIMAILNPPKPQSHILHHINRLTAVRRMNRADTLDPRFLKVPSSTMAQGKAEGAAATGMDFQERLALLLNMPSIMEALGLILQFNVAPAAFAGKSKIKIHVTVPPGPPGTPSLTIPFVSPLTLFDPTFFLPKSSDNIAISSDGWINLPDPRNGYNVDSLQLDSAAMQIYQFSNAAALRLVGKTAQRRRLKQSTQDPQALLSADVTRRNDEDYAHPILPPSPHTAGLTVWQDDRQVKVKDKVQKDSSVIPTDATQLAAEDLISGYAVDVCPKDGPWLHLTRRDEEYIISGKKLIAKDQERGVRTNGVRRSDTVNSTPNDYEIDETIFTWKRGSLVIKEPSNGKPLKSQSTEHLSGQSIPWSDGNGFSKQMALPATVAETGEPFVIPSPLFGTAYQVAMRPVYVTGRAPLFNKSIAPNNSLSGMFVRYELLQGPQLIIETRTTQFSKQDQQSLMFVASKLDANMEASAHIPKSIRYLIPSATTPEVARRHGKSEDDILTGATVFPLVDGAIPSQMPVPPGDSSGSYLPDPLCTGVLATLLDIAGNPIRSSYAPTIGLDYYSDGSDWPDYTVHCVELRSGPTLKLSQEAFDYAIPFPFPTEHSQKIVCQIPPGMTVVLRLTPRIDPKLISSHAFASFFGQNPTTDQIESSDICRPTILRMTHATDLPIWSPVAILQGDNFDAPPGIYPFDRSDTGIPKPIITTKYEPYSTSKVSIEASWTDIVDDLNLAEPANRNSSAHFLERSLPKLVTIGEAQVAMDNIDNYPTDSSAPVQLPFTDNRYRQVTVTTHGTSRFAGVIQDDLAIEPPTIVNAKVYDFIATAAPPVPDVEYIVPTLEWTFGDNTHTRAVGLSVILNRPWGVSGNGEKLAVVLSEDPAAGSPSGKDLADYLKMPSAYPITADYPAEYPIENRVSAWGTHRDWTPSARLGSAASAYKAGFISIQGGDPPIAFKENSVNRVITTFTPAYNAQDKKWFCNISFSKPPVYGAIVRLLLARHQPHAKDGCHLSRTIPCDFAMLGPNRSIVLSRSGFGGSKLKIQICGIGAYTAEGKLLTSFEVRSAAISNTNSIGFNWVEGDVIAPSSAANQAIGLLWEGSVDLNADEVIYGGAIVVREYETYRSVEDPTQTRQKLVYADAIAFN